MIGLYNKKFEHNGYSITITVHRDDNMGAPWKECDGHGVVSEWVHRDKRAGERLLCSRGGSKQFYEIELTTVQAKMEGWGLSEDAKAELAKKLGRVPTKGEIIAEAVNRDYEIVRGWCNNEWCWLGYTTAITTPDGKEIEGDSCWGFEGYGEGEKYMIGEALTYARHQMDDHMKTVTETEMAANWP